VPKGVSVQPLKRKSFKEFREHGKIAEVTASAARLFDSGQLPH
jgi:hypothetical protein